MDECLAIEFEVLVELGWAGMDEVTIMVVDAQCVNVLFA